MVRNPQEARFHLACEHGLIRRITGRYRPKGDVMMVSGVPVFYLTDYDGEVLLVKTEAALPEHLGSGVARLQAAKEQWLNILMSAQGRRQANVLRALVVIERLTTRLFGSARVCQGTGYLVHSITNEIIDAARLVANYGTEVDGTGEEAVFEHAIDCILEKINAANCRIVA